MNPYSNLKQEYPGVKQEYSDVKQDYSTVKQDYTGIKQDYAEAKQEYSRAQYARMKEEVQSPKDSYYASRASTTEFTPASTPGAEVSSSNAASAYQYPYSSRSSYDASTAGLHAYPQTHPGSYAPTSASSAHGYGSSSYHPGYGHPPSPYLPHTSPGYPSGTYHSPAGYMPSPPPPPTGERPLHHDRGEARGGYFCFDISHGGDCASREGKKMSTSSNLSRHIKEKEGNMPKVYCSKCGKDFTRKTARDQHVANNKCKRTGPTGFGH